MQQIATLAPHCVRCSAGVRKDGTLYFLLGDHASTLLSVVSTSLGSTSVVRDANGNVVSETRYKA